MTAPTHLHFSELRASEGQAQHILLFLHGILGTGANLRGLAQRLVRSNPSLAAVLVDLRGHGRSPDFSSPHTVAACAEDLLALEGALALPVAGVIGHSFGGKVALAYHAHRPALARVALLDCAPSARPDRAGSEETHAVIAMLERAPARFASRQEFIDYVQHNGHSRAIADWLTMNLLREPDGFRLRTNIPLIRALLDDYFTCDLWSVVEHSQARFDLVVAGQSQVYGQDDIARARALVEAGGSAREQNSGRVRTHVIAQAGHWVHVDAADEVVAALSA
jgi:pimeloyl-ACP methyl ester carboxylesterase